MKRLLLAVALFFAVGCAVAQDLAPVPKNRYYWYNPKVEQSQLAHVMIARGPGTLFESSIEAGIYLDDRLVADLRKNEVAPINVRPGKHKLTNAFSKHVHNIEIDVEAGNYYLYELTWDDEKRGYNMRLVRSEYNPG